MVEIVNENPERTKLFLANRDTSIKIGIYTSKDEPYGGIILDPLCWIMLEEGESPDKQWFARAVTGTGYLNITEFFKEKPRWPW